MQKMINYFVQGDECESQGIRIRTQAVQLRHVSLWCRYGI